MFSFLKKDSSTSNDKILIDKRKFKVFLEFDKDEDAFGRAKISKTRLTEEEFMVLVDLDSYLRDFQNNFYSKELKEKLKQKIEHIKPFVTSEVFILMESDKS